MAIVPRWYFDPTLGRCLQFEYGGCKGNENNFATERECHHRCIRSEDDYITIPDNERTGIVITEDPKPSTDPKPVKQGMVHLLSLKISGHHFHGFFNDKIFCIAEIFPPEETLFVSVVSASVVVE